MNQAIQIKKIGLGCVTFGREIDKHTAFSLMDYAAEREVYFWDTATVYGNGASEQIIGEWMAGNKKTSEKITLATKLLPPYSVNPLKTSVSKSLERLKIEYIDILYLHNWHESAITYSTLEYLNGLLKSSVVKAFGLSNFTYAQLKILLDNCEKLNFEKPAYIQNNHNYAVSDLTEEMILLCREKNIKIITYSPLGAGFLTGKHISGVVEGSRFDVMPAHQNIYFTDESLLRLDVLLKASEQHGITPSKLALAWALNQPFVSSVLIGVKEKKHIDQAIDALSFSLNQNISLIH